MLPPPPPHHPFYAFPLDSPLLDGQERVLVGQVEHDDETHRSAVIRGGDGAIALLTGCVPYLQLHSLVVPNGVKMFMLVAVERVCVVTLNEFFDAFLRSSVKGQVY